jgi:CTD small phosphatase-like protein 2
LLGRDLSTIIIVDNLPENFDRQPFNGIEILTWVEDAWDTELESLAKQLDELLIQPTQLLKTA